MRLEVDTGAFHSATDTCYAANHALVDAIADLDEALLSGASMAGADAGGRDWAASYDGVATDLVAAGADLGGSLGAIGNLLNASLVNHEGADYSARIYGPPGGGWTGDGDPEHGCERLLPAAVPSAAGGCGSPPVGWHWLADHLQGYVWPDADTGALRAAGSAWQRGAGALTSTGWSVDAARLDIENQTSPEIGPAVQVCTQLTQHCDDLASAYRDVGRACTGYADQVDEHHHEIAGIIKELLAWTVIDQVTGAVLSFFTAGAAELAAQLAESGILATYAARVVKVLRRLVELARAAAELIGACVARVAAVAARLKRLLTAKVMIALDKVASRELRASLARVRALLDYSERGIGHTFETHAGLTDEQLAKRLADRPGLPAASTFTDRATAVRELSHLLNARASEVAEWLAGTRQQLVINEDTGHVIGRTFSATATDAADSTALRAVLVRDPDAPGGYIVLTSYPT